MHRAVSFALELPNMSRRINTLKPNIVALGAAILAIAAAACGDLTSVPASLPTLSDSGAVYALNGAPVGAPTALYVFSGALLPANSSFVFDVAFDIDASGAAVLIPMRAVATGLSSTHTVGLQKVNVLFDSLTVAPKSGYRADTALVVPLGQVVAIQSSDPSACSVSLTGTVLYAKVVVTGIDRATKKLSVRYTVDPNCGFVSFAPGLPKD
jgi:hypothetical protein